MNIVENFNEKSIVKDFYQEGFLYLLEKDEKTKKLTFFNPLNNQYKYLSPKHELSDLNLNRFWGDYAITIEELALKDILKQKEIFNCTLPILGILNVKQEQNKSLFIFLHELSRILFLLRDFNKSKKQLNLVIKIEESINKFKEDFSLEKLIESSTETLEELRIILRSLKFIKKNQMMTKKESIKAQNTGLKARSIGLDLDLRNSQYQHFLKKFKAPITLNGNLSEQIFAELSKSLEILTENIPTLNNHFELKKIQNLDQTYFYEGPVNIESFNIVNGVAILRKRND
jgi:hypothetical protein